MSDELRFCPECDEWKIPASIRPTIVEDYVRCGDCIKRELAHRSCGDCRECCTTVAENEIGKPEGVACEHLCAEGGGVYDTRPGTCESFECMWLHGKSLKTFKSEALRPDRSGAVFYPESGERIGKFMVMICQMSTAQDFKRPVVQKAISKLLHHGTDVVVKCEGEAFLLRASELEAAK